MRYHRQIDDVRAHIQTLRVVIGVLVLLCTGLWIGWDRAPKQITLHYPPDLRSGAVLALDEVPVAQVYAFAHYLFQQLYCWPRDGAEDYGRQIYRLAAYLTPRYQEELRADLRRRGQRGELAGRTRALSALPGHGYEERRVEILGTEVWTVWLDMDITETVRGMTVKRTVVRYPLRVVRYAVDPEHNPWGLALDGFEAPGPRRLTAEEIKREGFVTPPEDNA
jgi:integrating conjugative element protein (TIGR03746 family)